MAWVPIIAAQSPFSLRPLSLPWLVAPVQIEQWQTVSENMRELRRPKGPGYLSHRSLCKYVGRMSRFVHGRTVPVWLYLLKVRIASGGVVSGMDGALERPSFTYHASLKAMHHPHLARATTSHRMAGSIK
jgi:hypothetical protein